jgi:hypothetical protein
MAMKALPAKTNCQATALAPFLKSTLDSAAPAA